METTSAPQLPTPLEEARVPGQAEAEKHAPRRALAIGLDIGATFTRVCCIDGADGAPHLVLSERSVVAYSKSGPLLGEEAEAAPPCSQVRAAKLLIGRRFTDAAARAVHAAATASPAWEPRVVGGAEDDRTLFVVRPGDADTAEETRVSPEEAAAAVVASLCGRLPARVSGAVAAVPTAFLEAQRQATRDAAAIAGIGMLGVASDAEAAATALGLLAGPEPLQVAVIDIGASTHDVALLSVKDRMAEVRARAGGPGGNALDRAIAAHLLGEDAAELGAAGEEFLRECERAKIKLSSAESAEVVVRGEARTLTRGELSAVCEEVLRPLLQALSRILAAAGLAPEQVDHVVLVGGGSRVPRIRELVRSFFKGKEPRPGPQDSIAPDEAVVLGAAMIAQKIAGSASTMVITPEVPEQQKAKDSCTVL